MYLMDSEPKNKVLIKPELIGPLLQAKNMYNILKLQAKSCAWTKNFVQTRVNKVYWGGESDTYIIRMKYACEGVIENPLKCRY